MTSGSTAPATKNAFSMDFAFPYIIYDYEAKNHKVVTADFLVVGTNGFSGEVQDRHSVAGG